MAHSQSKIWIHLVFCTKYRTDLISPEVEIRLYEEIKHQFLNLGCLVRNINGYTDHVHVLFMLNPQHSVREIVGRVKGASSHAISRNEQLSPYFSWSAGYYAKSVSESHLDVIDRYIDNQKKHHSGK
ncbi:MAG: IS200/IS605 family transposase [Bacteroidota bacterium]